MYLNYWYTGQHHRAK